MAMAYVSSNTSGNVIWPIWCSNLNNTNQTAIFSNSAWTIWNQAPIQAPTVVKSDTGETWIIWSGMSNQTGSTIPLAMAVPQASIQPARVLSEHVAVANADWERRQVEQRVYAEARKAANDKAHGLLLEHLDNRQRRSLSKRGWFQARGGLTGRQYKIHGDRCAGNIIELEGRKEVAQLCVHADHSIPLGDQLLAQLLHIQHDEEFLLRRANRTVLH
jgi:hypothetical protein